MITKKSLLPSVGFDELWYNGYTIGPPELFTTMNVLLFESIKNDMYLANETTSPSCSAVQLAAGSTW